MFISPASILENLKIQNGEIVCDFGCGNGFYVFLLSKMVGEKGKVFGIDKNLNLLDRLQKEAEKKHLENINFIYSDLEDKVYIDDNFCDLVIISNLLSEVNNLEKVLDESKRILKRNGRILIIDWKEKDHVLSKNRNILKEEILVALLAKKDLFIQKNLSAGEFHYAVLVN